MDDSTVFVSCCSYRAESLKESEAARALWTIRVKLDGIRADSEPTVTLTESASFVTFITSGGNVVCQKLAYIISTRSDEEPGDSSAESSRDEDYFGIKAQSFRIPRGITAKCSHAQYFMGVAEQGQQFLALGSPSRSARLPLKIDIERHDSWHVVLPGTKSMYAERTRRTRKRNHRNSPAPAVHPQGGAKRNDESVARDVLCETCRAVVRNSSLLADSSAWIEIPTKDIRHQPGHAPQEIGTGTKIQDFSIHFPDEENGQVRQSDVPPQTDPEFARKAPIRPRYEHHEHYQSLEQLAQSVLHGCHLCALFLSHTELNVRHEVQKRMDAVARSTINREHELFDISKLDSYPSFQAPNPSELSKSLPRPFDSALQWLPQESSIDNGKPPPMFVRMKTLQPVPMATVR